MARNIISESATPVQQVTERIRAERNRKRVSLRELGDQIGVSAATVSNLETGKRALTVADIFSIAAALGAEVAGLLGIGPRSLHPVVQAVQDALDDDATTEWERRQLLTITRNGFQTWSEMRRPPAARTPRAGRQPEPMGTVDASVAWPPRDGRQH